MRLLGSIPVAPQPALRAQLIVEINLQKPRNTKTTYLKNSILKRNYRCEGSEGAAGFQGYHQPGFQNRLRWVVESLGEFSFWRVSLISRDLALCAKTFDTWYFRHNFFDVRCCENPTFGTLSSLKQILGFFPVNYLGTCHLRQVFILSSIYFIMMWPIHVLSLPSARDEWICQSRQVIKSSICTSNSQV